MEGEESGIDQLKGTGASDLLNKEEIYLIGLFIVVWNEAEFLMRLLTMIALESDFKETGAIMGGFSIAVNADIFASILEKRGRTEEIKKEAQSCANRIKELSSFRNLVAHGMWLMNESTGQPDAKNDFLGKKKTKAVTIEDIRENYIHLRELVVRLGKLTAKVAALPPPSD